MSLTSGPDATLYVAHPGGVDHRLPRRRRAPVDVLDVGPDESISAIGTEANGGNSWSSATTRASSSWSTSRPARSSPSSPDTARVTNAVIGRSPGGPPVSTTTETEGVVRTLDDPALLRETLYTMSGRDLTDLEWRRFVGAATPQPVPAGCPETYPGDDEPGRSG